MSNKFTETYQADRIMNALAARGLGTAPRPLQRTDRRLDQSRLHIGMVRVSVEAIGFSDNLALLCGYDSTSA